MEEHNGESIINENALIEDLVSRMTELESKFIDKFDHSPMRKTIINIVSDESKDNSIDPLKLCAIFTDFADTFLEKAFDTSQTIDQNTKLSKELYKANDLIRRLTDENEYHLNKLKYLAKQLEIYKDSWRGKMTEQSVERQISDLLKQKDEEVQDLKSKLSATEQEYTQYRLQNKEN